MMATWQSWMQQRWQNLSAREQRGLLTLGFVLALVVFWQVLVAPAQQTLQKAQTQGAALTQHLAHMQALQAQAQALQQRTALSRDSALTTLQGLTHPPAIQLNPQGDRVLVTLKGVPAQVLSEWLAQTRTQAQALPSEVHLTRTALGWDGSLVLVLPRAQPAGGR